MLAAEAAALPARIALAPHDRGQELTKDYGEKRAVDGLTFTVQPGIVTGFLGPNGSGQVDDDAADPRARRARRRAT